MRMTVLTNPPTILLIGMGGTIAGLRLSPEQPGYRAGQLLINQLASQIKSKLPIQNKQIANIDSCDMCEVLLSQLGNEALLALNDSQIAGLVITHGTDTMEETALFLELVCGDLARVLGKKLVLTGAMLPADDPQADGPTNLNAAVALVEGQKTPGGVFGLMGGKTFLARDLAKRHTSRLDAFSLEQLNSGSDERQKRDTQVSEDLPIPPENQWPRVEIVSNHIGARGDMIELFKEAGVEGIVLAGTGGGTVHQSLAVGLEAFTNSGGALVRSSRVGLGSIPTKLANGRLSKAIGAGDLNPVKARIALQLALFASRQTKANALSWQEIFARIALLPESW